MDLESRIQRVEKAMDLLLERLRGAISTQEVEEIKTTLQEDEPE